MPRILVADDNSNIQKMVANALQDTNIEVVAVSNGGAAIRALPDSLPDLVLADVFMPVRSGYEVCDFIKHEPPYSKIPVVLLVGAFDPLDEQEAQRVAADGILKKPFVPPDPLITMVKALLARVASEKMAAQAVAVSVGAPVQEARVSGLTPAGAPPPPTAEFTDASPEELLAPPVTPSFDPQDSTLAFSTLLDSPAAEEPTFAVRHHLSDVPAVGDVEDLSDHSWSNAFPPMPMIDDGTPENGAASLLDSLPSIEFGGNALENIESTLPPGEPVEPAEIEPSIFEPSGALSEEALLRGLKDGTATEFPELKEKVTEEIAEYKADKEEPLSWALTPEAATETPAAELAVAPVRETEAAPEAEKLEVEKLEAEQLEVSAPEARLETSTPTASAEPPSWPGLVAPIFPGSQSLWARVHERSESPAQTESEPLASAAPLANPGPGQPAAEWPAAFQSDILAPKELAPVGAPAELEPVVAAREEAAEPAASPAPVAAAHAEAASEVRAAATSVAEPAPPDPALIEAVVSRIIERMQPKVIDVVTREILRPLVEALVHREINKQ